MIDGPIEDMTDEQVKAFLVGKGYSEEKMAIANLKVLKAVNTRLRVELDQERKRADRLETACHLALLECSLRAHIDYERVIYVVEKLLTEALDKPDDNKGEPG